MRIGNIEGEEIKMKKHRPICIPIFLLWSWTLLFNAPLAWAGTATDYKSVPPFITSGAPPLVMLVMGRDHKLYYEAYNDASDLNDDGVLDVRYNPAIDYYGYFDNKKCYTYSTARKRFEPTSQTTNGKKCELSGNADWSGDFLNYLTMSRMDTMRKVLYGGYRSTDTATETVLERVFIPQDAHSWGKEYTSIAVDGYDIADYAPVTVPTSNRRHFFASTTRTGPTSPPQLIYVLNQSDRIWNWIAKEAPVVDPRTNEVIREVRVKVCDPSIGLESNCKEYPNGNYKPIGILQRHGESLWDATATPPAYKTPKMYFGLMTGSYAKSTSGGVLRKKIGNISDEIETNTTGVFKTSVNGIIQTINKLRIYGYSYSNKNYNLNCGWIIDGPMTEGQCRDWGNPIAEIMYEATRYFAGAGSPTAAFNYSGSTDDTNLGLPKDTWNDPYDPSDCGFEHCSKPFMLVLSDINPSYDSNQLPGVDANFGTGITSTLPGLNVSTIANTISTQEGISNSKKFIGQSGAVSNGVCSEKSIGGLGSIRGLCPEEPTKLGSYYSASVAHYARTTDLQPAVASEQKVTTYGVGLASPLPQIELKVGPNQKLVTLVPFGKSVGNNGETKPWAYQPTNTIVEFFVEEWTPTYGRFQISFEDVEQGADHDMDAIVRYEYQLVDAANIAVTDPLLAAKVKVTLASGYASGGYIQHMGYIISGTTADGPYLVVKDSDTTKDFATDADTIPPKTMLQLTDTRFFTPATGATAAQLLPNPLWYAAKWGAYDEKDAIAGPNLQEEWDKDHDGIPDTYFYVSNPLKLEEQLNKSFADILRRTTSGTAASVISGSRSGEGAIYQSVFYPEYSDDKNNSITWAGSVHASFVDDLGRMREDTNQNRILDINDKVIEFRKQVDGTLVIDKYGLIGAKAEITRVTLPSATSLNGTYFLLNSVGEDFYVWFTVDGHGTDPRTHGFTGIPVALTSGDAAAAVATKTAAAINAYGAFSVPVPVAGTIAITNTVAGDVPDATAETSGVTINVTQQGVGETTQLDFTGNAEDIQYLWNSNTWLNSISDSDIVIQRDYTSADHRRYIFTFIDKDQNKIAGSGEQLPFSSPSLPTVANLTDPATIFPYIPINSNSAALPTSASLTIDPNGGNRDEFLRKQTQRIINYTRGLDQGTTTLTTGTGGTIPAFRSRKLDLDNDGTLETTWRLGDIVNSSPTVVNKPSEALHLLYKDTSYATFAAKYANRRTVLYTGANDGMLHAFNGGFYEDRFDVFPVDPAERDGIKDVEYLLQPKKITSPSSTPVVWGPDTSYTAHALGAELWAYVPYNLLPHLYWPTEPDYEHVYYVDLKPRVFDAKIFTPDDDHPGGWGTVLVGGMRFGGGKITVDMNRRDGNVDRPDRTMTSAYFILDITNPEKPPTVLGEITFPHLGYTTVYPAAATMKDKVETAGSPNAWYLIFGSGPAESDGSPGTTSGVSLSEAISGQKAKLYVVDLVELAKNKVLKTVDTSGTLTTIDPEGSQPGYFHSFDNDNNAFISDPITVDYDLDYKADAVYFGTQSYKADNAAGTEWGGKLRRIVMNDDINPSSWNEDSVLIDLERNATDPASGFYQPITASPTAGADSAGNNWIYFGTGRYFIRNDKDITEQQTFYGIKEPRDTDAPFANIYTEVSHADLYDSTSIEVNTATGLVSGGPVPPSGTTDAPISWNDFVTSAKTFRGWYYNFTDSLERNVGQAALYGDLLTFTSYVPSNDICTYEGSSYLYALYYLTGTAPPRPVIYTSTSPDPVSHLKRISLGAGLVSKPSIHVGTKDGSTVFVQTSEGAVLTLDEENPGQTKSGRTSWGYRE